MNKEGLRVERDFSNVRRVVIKVGTNLLSAEHGINLRFLKKIAEEISNLVKEGYQPLLVSSGAIGMGAKELGYITRVQSIAKRQAFASIGQPLLMYNYRTEFSKFNLIVSQILLTRSILNNRQSFLNLRNSVEALLEIGVIPIFNENDSVSTDEIGTAFGDNDTLSALIASKVDADLLIILTDIDGLYDGNPRKESSASLVHTVKKIDKTVKSWASGAGSTFSTGGMQTKLRAAEIAAKAGCGSIIAKGTEPQILQRILSGELVGTFIHPSARLSQRNRWIMQSTPNGRIVIDDGAVAALRLHKSLLPSGIIRVEGVFEKGTVVMINDVAKAVPSFNSREIEDLIGLHSSNIRDMIGQHRRDVIARPEDIVFLDDHEVTD